jgi:hypothetical protein
MGLTEDAQCIREELKKLIESEQKDVLVIAHSYGGVVCTEAVDADLSRGMRQAKGLTGGVIHLIYMCAFLLPQNNSLASTFGGQLPPFIKIDVGGLV